MAAEFPLGTGKRSATLSLSLGLCALGGVLCLLFPEYLTTSDLRARYPLAWLRAALRVVLVIGFTFGVYGVTHGRYRRQSAAGIALAVTATLLGGASVPVESTPSARHTIGLDWFVLNLFFTAVVFVPLERLFPRLSEQRLFRPGFATDLAHFAVSHLLVQVSLLLTILPAAALMGWAVRPELQRWVSGCPRLLQFIAAVVLVDLCHYAVHRSFHAVPMLWRFHAIHHSSVALDWLAASRLHVVDILLTRAVAFVPLYVFGFDPWVIGAYLLLVSLHAVFNHANVAWDAPALNGWVATPRFHHWHHAAEPAAVIHKNFAAHLPLIDRILGTYSLPNGWPSRYGIAGDPVPPDFGRQLIWPFRNRRCNADATAGAPA